MSDKVAGDNGWEERPVVGATAIEGGLSGRGWGSAWDGQRGDGRVPGGPSDEEGWGARAVRAALFLVPVSDRHSNQIGNRHNVHCKHGSQLSHAKEV